MPAYLLALEVDPVETGKSYPMLPLHCTLVHWFWCDLRPSPMQQVFGTEFLGSKPPQLQVGELAIFMGQSKHGLVSVKVNKVKITAALRAMHERACHIVDASRGHYAAPQYVKEGFCPHITHTKGYKLTVGIIVRPRAIYLVEADAPEYGNTRTIVARFEFAGFQ